MNDKLQYILVNGYGWTGSSIVIDFLNEYKNIYAPKCEFRLIKDPHGIADLDSVINSRTDQLNVDIAIKEFYDMAKIYSRRGGHFKALGGGLEKEFGREIYTITDDFISEITDYVYRGYWHYLDFNDSGIRYFFKRLNRKLNKKALYEDMRISLANEDRFLSSTRKYLNRIFFNALKGNDEIDTVVLDQAVHPMKLSMAGRYFDNYRIIVVDRDPRDVYANLIKRKTLVGYDSGISHDPALFIMWFKSQHSSNADDENILKLKFEDIVLHSDKVTEQIIKYCNLDEAVHVDVGRFFNPEKSKGSIKIYDKYASDEEIRMIEKELGEYLYED